ncbi:spore germination protein GerW family protein [Oscillospiraceae bacterium WX1]
MDQQLNLTENVNSLFQSLEDFTQKEGIIGKPVTQGEKTFLPVVSVTLGYGGGNASMKGQGGSSSSTGTSASSSTGTGAMGLGAKLCTDAVIVIEGQNVSVLPVNAAGASTSLVDKIPQIISGMKGQGQSQSAAQNQSSQANQSQNQAQNSNQQTPAFK